MIAARTSRVTRAAQAMLLRATGKVGLDALDERDASVSGSDARADATDTAPDIQPDITLPSGCGTWTNSQVTSDVNLNDIPDLALDAQGGTHVVYRTSGGDLRYGYRPAQGTWTTELIEAATGEGQVLNAPFSIVAAAGEVHVAYLHVGNGTLKYAHRTVNGTWSNAVIDSALDQRPLLKVDSALGVHIVYRVQTTAIARYAYLPAGGAWSEVTIATQGTDVWCESFQLDGSDVAHMACMQRAAPTDVARSQVVYVRRATPTSAFEVSIAGTTQSTVHSTTLAVDSTGAIHIVFTTLSAMQYAYRATPTSSWSNTMVTSDFYSRRLRSRRQRQRRARDLRQRISVRHVGRASGRRFMDGHSHFGRIGHLVALVGNRAVG